MLMEEYEKPIQHLTTDELSLIRMVIFSFVSSCGSICVLNRMPATFTIITGVVCEKGPRLTERMTSKCSKLLDTRGTAREGRNMDLFALIFLRNGECK